MTNRKLQSIVSGDRRRTGADLDHAAAKAASGFLAAGVGEGDAIALLLRNDFACLEAQLAAQLIGAFAVPINWHAASDEIAHILAESDAKAVVAHADLADIIRLPAGKRMPFLLVETPTNIRSAFGVDDVKGRMAVDATDWDQWIANFPPTARTATGQVAPIAYTSGSSGRPKGVRRDGPSGGSSKAIHVYGLNLPGRLRVLINGPLYHSVPNAYARLALQAGADIVLEPHFQAEKTLKLISQHAITHLHIVPAAMLQLLRLPSSVRQLHDHSSLRHVVHGAAPCPPRIKRAMIDWWGPIIHEYYGSTEMGLVTLANTQDFLERPGTVGRPLAGIVVKILDCEGEQVATGAVGRIFAGSNHMHRFTYVNQPDARNAVGRGDLVTAGDLGRLDTDGYLYVLGRETDIIHICERDISAAEVEAAVLQHEAVRDCAAFGLSDGSASETICVCLETDTDNIDTTALTRLVGDALGTRKFTVRFKRIEFLPRESSGKIFKQRLREEFSIS